ncbi:MAG: ABC transporter ATP-binding protein [Methylococcaceae bacterium]|nr:ABC transporter ATP-binding protein [Methylococcaceae bacterium]
MSVIRVSDVVKDYPIAGGYYRALQGVSLEIAQGEYVAIMGHSGSGKSTFMNLLGCLDRYTQGRYWLNSCEVGSLSRNELAQLRNRTLGFVFQGFNLLSRMNLADNIGLPLVYAGVSKAERRRRAQALLDRVGLGAYAESHPNQISGGQQQRVAIARALINQPRVLLADEPTGNLDSQTSEEILAIFRQLNADGITIVLVTHEADVAAHALRQVGFRDGRIVRDEPTAEAGRRSPPC